MKRFLIFCVALAAATGLNAFGQQWARQRLAKSACRLEWIKLNHDGRTVDCFVASPRDKTNATAVLLVHERFGLTDWAREVADEFAAAGYIAVAPDLLSGSGPSGGGSSSISDVAGLNKAVASLNPARVSADLNAAVRYAQGLRAANGKVAAVGFSWGGTEALRLASLNADLKAVFVFYGVAPDDEQGLARIKCPIYGFYAAMDESVCLTIPQTEQLMQKAGKTFETVTYTNASHAFMRSGAQAEFPGPNRDAHEQAWKRLMEVLKKI